MIGTFSRIIQPLKQIHGSLLSPTFVLQQQLRTTFILKRKYPTPLHKKGYPMKRLRGKHYIYEFIKDTTTEKENDLNLILTHYVEGLGNPGEKITVGATYAYNKLLIPGLAVYASPENVERFKDYAIQGEKHSSPYADMTAKHLNGITLSVVMNMENPWTLQKWHIRSSFRKSGYTVPDEAITMPSKPVKGPDMNLEDREFYVTVTINNFEKINVRCRIHHWSTKITDRIPYVSKFWFNSPGPVFPEDAPILDAMPKRTKDSKRHNTETQ